MKTTEWMATEGRKQRILIVDDIPFNISMLIDVLRVEYIVNVATNGERALELAKGDHKPDLILLDIIMPGLDGFEICSRLKSDSRTQNIPIIFITARGEFDNETRGFELGAVDYISKPFHIPTVKARVKTHLELKRHRDFLEMLSYCDGLTGIYNRRRLDEYLKIMWDYALRESRPISLILLDIDNFKAYNDHYGHTYGDESLKKVAVTLAASVKRSIDLVARYGGEEFACVLPATDKQGGMNVAETMMQNIESLAIPHIFNPPGGILTLSIGVASLLPSRDMSPDYIVKCADEALYHSKERGKNKITVG